MMMGAAEGQSNLAARLKPAHAGHIDIQQNQIRCSRITISMASCPSFANMTS